MKNKIIGIIVCTFLIAAPVFSVTGTIDQFKTLNLRNDENGDLIQQSYDRGLLLDGWLEQAKLNASDGSTSGNFGHSVAICDDIAIIGATWGENNNGVSSGSAYIFQNISGEWIQQAKLSPSDGSTGDYFGYSVAICNDTAIIGAYEDDDNGDTSGSAYIFQKTEEGWVQQAKLLPSDGKEDDWFGWSVAILDDTAFIGARHNWLGSGSGSVYIYQKTEEGWVQQAKLLPSDGADGDCFGDSVSFNDDTAIIGAVGSDPYGSAYIFQKTEEGWLEQVKLLPSDVKNNDYFGGSVSISGDTVIIGKSGSAYIFQNVSGVWVEQAKLLASDGSTYDNFGFSVSISGDTAFIGAPQDYDNVGGSGSAYIFQKIDGGWVQQAKQWASDGAGLHLYFGGSVSISGDTAIIGASGGNNNGDSSGSAYVFKKVGKNQQPNKPNIEGPTSGKLRTEYTYCIISNDPDEDSLHVYWKWDDGYTSNWTEKWLGPFEHGEEICDTHWWFEKRTYIINVIVRDIYGSMATGSLEVSMPKIRPINNLFYWLFEQHPRLFPILRQLFDF